MANPANGYAAEPALEILYRRPAYPLHGWLVRRPACAGVAMPCASSTLRFPWRNEKLSAIRYLLRSKSTVATSRNSRQRDWRVRTGASWRYRLSATGGNVRPRDVAA